MPDDLTGMQQWLCRTVTGQRSDTMTMMVAMTSIAIADFSGEENLSKIHIHLVHLPDEFNRNEDH